jgi:hypothetical protein
MTKYDMRDEAQSVQSSFGLVVRAARRLNNLMNTPNYKPVAS